MGTIHYLLRDFYDETSEYIGIKSGLLLNRFQITRILSTIYDDDFLKSDDLSFYFPLSSDKLSDIYCFIRRKIGNLPFESPNLKERQKLREYCIKSDIELLAKIIPICFHYLDLNPYLSANDLALCLEKNEFFPQEITLDIAAVGLEEWDKSLFVSPQWKRWDCITSLSSLYNCEVRKENSLEFLDQKFIDYLAVNGTEIEKIHWRNFERLCAEYFRRNGYKVILGSGRNDGGIDIRAFSNEKTSLPSIVIQCKRCNSENKVSIETVKAFYTDVYCENAEQGLIATSSYIAPGGKKIVDARKYNISFAEKEKVETWARNMWRFV